MIPFHLNYLPKVLSPNPITPEVMASTWEFRDNAIQSREPIKTSNFSFAIFIFTTLKGAILSYFTCLKLYRLNLKFSTH